MMKLKSILAAVTSGFLLIPFSAQASELVLNTETYNYLNYLDSNNKVTGSSTEILRKVLENSGVKAKFQHGPVLLTMLPHRVEIVFTL